MPAENEGPFDKATELLQQKSFPSYFRNGQQHDAEELFRYLMHALAEPSKKDAHKSPVVSLVSSLEAWERHRRSPAASTSLRALESISGSRRLSSVGFGSRDPKMPFEGMDASSLRCAHCGAVSGSGVRCADFLNLNLALPRVQGGPVTLEQCLEHFTRTEAVDDYRCDRCSLSEGSGTLRTVLKRTLIARYPQALCLHLQIASADGGDHFSPFKHHTFVRFPETLDLSPYHVGAHPAFFGSHSPVSSSATPPHNFARPQGHRVRGGDASFDEDPEERPRIVRTDSPSNNLKVEPYNLRAVIVHHGVGVGAGHFTSFRRLLRDSEGRYCAVGDYDHFARDAVVTAPRADDQWVAVSDANVWAVSRKEVLGSNAYMLFYEREETRAP